MQLTKAAQALELMKAIGKAVVVSVATTVSLGIVLGLVFILLGQGQHEAGRDTTLWQALLAAVPFVTAITLPLGVVGGALASIFLHRQRVPASVLVWVVRGIGTGSLVGALGAAAVPILLMGALRSGAGAIMVAVFSLFGAVGGVLTGAIVGLWCYRAQQAMRRIHHAGTPTGA